MATRSRTGSGSSLHAARGLVLVLGIGVLLAATSCGGGATEGESPGTRWGPLAVADIENGPEALTAGIIQITDSCVLLDEGDESVLLVWPQARTTWRSQDGVVGFVTGSGERVVLRDGDRVTFGGGASSLREGGTTVDEFLDSVDWVSEPDRDCVGGERWFVGNVVTDSGA